MMNEGRNNLTAGVIGPRRSGGSSGAAMAEADPAVESFYHLSGVDLTRCACRGTACFVARHLNPGRWDHACTQGPRVHCLGRCYAAPAAGDDDPGPPACRVDAREAVVLGRIIRGGAASLGDYQAMGGYRALEEARRRPPESVVAEVESSGLRGRGGAGFPTGRKWRMASRQAAPEKHIVANADEGDAGAYIDRFILEKDPHRLIEAMAIAGHAVGASRGWIYLRREYPAAAPVLRRALEEARAGGFLGPNVAGGASSFDIELHIGRGSYLCGEETALLAAIEGRRPAPAPPALRY